MLEAISADEPSSARLWPASYSAYRARWNALGAALSLPHSTGAGITPASLRGGAMQYFALMKDLGRLQRGARWRRISTLETYVQEVSPTAFVLSMSPQTKELLQTAAGLWPGHLRAAHSFLSRGVAPCLWWRAMPRITARERRASPSGDAPRAA